MQVKLNTRQRVAVWCGMGASLAVGVYQGLVYHTLREQSFRFSVTRWRVPLSHTTYLRWHFEGNWVALSLCTLVPLTLLALVLLRRNNKLNSGEMTAVTPPSGASNAVSVPL